MKLTHRGRVKLTAAETLDDIQVVIGRIIGKPGQVEARVPTVKALVIDLESAGSFLSAAIVFEITQPYQRNQAPVHQAVRDFAKHRNTLRLGVKGRIRKQKWGVGSLGGFEILIGVKHTRYPLQITVPLGNQAKLVVYGFRIA